MELDLLDLMELTEHLEFPAPRDLVERMEHVAMQAASVPLVWKESLEPPVQMESLDHQEILESQVIREKLAHL